MARRVVLRMGEIRARTNEAINNKSAFQQAFIDSLLEEQTQLKTMGCYKRKHITDLSTPMSSKVKNTAVFSNVSAKPRKKDEKCQEKFDIYGQDKSPLQLESQQSAFAALSIEQQNPEYFKKIQFQDQQSNFNGSNNSTSNSKEKSEFQQFLALKKQQQREETRIAERFILEISQAQQPRRERILTDFFQNKKHSSMGQPFQTDNSKVSNGNLNMESSQNEPTILARTTTADGTNLRRQGTAGLSSSFETLLPVNKALFREKSNLSNRANSAIRKRICSSNGGRNKMERKIVDLRNQQNYDQQEDYQLLSNQLSALDSVEQIKNNSNSTVLERERTPIEQQRCLFKHPTLVTAIQDSSTPRNKQSKSSVKQNPFHLDFNRFVCASKEQQRILRHRTNKRNHTCILEKQSQSYFSPVCDKDSNSTLHTNLSFIPSSRLTETQEPQTPNRRFIVSQHLKQQNQNNTMEIAYNNMKIKNPMHLGVTESYRIQINPSIMSSVDSQLEATLTVNGTKRQPEINQQQQSSKNEQLLDSCKHQKNSLLNYFNSVAVFDGSTAAHKQQRQHKLKQQQLIVPVTEKSSQNNEININVRNYFKKQINNRRNIHQESSLEDVNSQYYPLNICSSNSIRSRILSVTPNKLAEMSLLGERLLQNNNNNHKTLFRNEQESISVSQKVYLEKSLTDKCQGEVVTLLSGDTLGMLSSTSSSSHASSSNIVPKYIYSNQITETPKRREAKRLGLENYKEKNLESGGEGKSRKSEDYHMNSCSSSLTKNSFKKRSITAIHGKKIKCTDQSYNIGITTMDSPDLCSKRRSRRLIDKSISSEKDTEKSPGFIITLDSIKICEGNN